MHSLSSERAAGTSPACRARSEPSWMEIAGARRSRRFGNNHFVTRRFHNRFLQRPVIRVVLLVPCVVSCLKTADALRIVPPSQTSLLTVSLLQCCFLCTSCNPKSSVFHLQMCRFRQKTHRSIRTSLCRFFTAILQINFCPPPPPGIAQPLAGWGDPWGYW